MSAAIRRGRMPPTQTDEGPGAAREIRERDPGVRVLVLSQHAEAGDPLDPAIERHVTRISARFGPVEAAITAAARSP